MLGMVFDMDGVIVDSTAAHVEAWRRYLAGHGIGLDGIEHRMLGKHNGEIVREFFAGAELTAGEIAGHGAEKEKLYRQLIGPELQARLVPGIVEFLRRHREIPLAVASNAEPENVEFVLERAGIRDLFRVTMNGHEVARPKPDPEIYLRVADRLRLPPAQCIVFEDSLTGVEAGRAAGMRVVGVATTMTEFRNVELTIRDFHAPELEAWLRDTITHA